MLVPVGGLGEILVDEVGVAKSRLRVDDLEVLDDGVHVGLGGAGVERSKDVLVHRGDLALARDGASHHLAKVRAALVRSGVDGVPASGGGSKVLGRRGVPVGILLGRSFAMFGVTGMLKVGDNGLHRDAVLDRLLDRLSLGSGGGVGGAACLGRIGDDGGHPVGAAVVSREHVGGVFAAPLREALEAGRLKRRRDVGAGASVDKVDNLLDSLGVGEGGANVVVSDLEGVVAGVGGDGGDEAVGDVVGASHAGGNLAESAESDFSIVGGTHDGGLSEETVDVLLGDAVVVVVCSLRGVHGAEHPVEHLSRFVVGKPGLKNAPESLALADDLDEVLGGTDLLVDQVGIPENVLGVEHLQLLDDVGGIFAGESLADGRVYGSLTTLAGAGVIVGASLLRAAVDGGAGLAGGAVIVGGSLVPVGSSVKLRGADNGEHAHHVPDGLLEHLLLGVVLLGIRGLERDGRFFLRCIMVEQSVEFKKSSSRSSGWDILGV